MRHVNESKIAFGDLGCYAGPPIERCPTQERLIENAQRGSERLLNALRRTGVRP